MSKEKKGVKKKGPSKVLERDFEVFAKGVKRLEELRAELNNINTSGYEREAAIIRGKLKNVAYIPQIEKEIIVLRNKIDGKYKERSVNSSGSHAKIHKQISELEKELEKRKKISRQLEMDMDEIKSVPAKVSRDLKLVKEIPKIESQLSSFKRYLREQKEDEERKKDLLKKIDPGVDFLVDSKFDLTLNEIKAELSKRLKDRESFVKKQLQEDLEARKKNFELQYKDLENQFERKYRDKIDSSLDDEIKRRFGQKLEERILRIKRLLQKDKVSNLNERKEHLNKKEKEILDLLVKQRNEHKNKLDREYNLKLKDYENRIKKEYKNSTSQEVKKIIQKEKDRLRSEQNASLSELTKKHEILKKIMQKEKRDLIEEREKELQYKHSKDDAEKLAQDLKTQFELKRKGIEKDYYDNLSREKQRLKEHYDQQVLAYRHQMNNKMHEHITQEVNNLKEHNREEVKKAISEKYNELRKLLKEEFDQKLKSEIRAKEAEFEKKKAELTEDIQRKAKKLFS